MVLNHRNRNGNYKPSYEEDKEGLNDKTKSKPRELPKKEFVLRNSLLTDLWEDIHVRTVYHIFLAILFGLFACTAANDYLNNGQARFGYRLISKGFTNHLHLLLLIWTMMFLSQFLIYYGFKTWAAIRMQKIGKFRTTWDVIWLSLCITYSVSLMYYVTLANTNLEFSHVLSVTLLSELTRFLMKTYSFVRINAPIALRYKLNGSGNQESYCPTLKQFLYFSFAPTLIYQDSYPRTNKIRWNYVLVCFLEFIGGLFYLSFLAERFLIPTFENYCLKPYRWQDIVLTILSNAASGMLIMLVIWYISLHSWMNAFAEMLRFGDRLFYKDWWVSTTYDRYFRTWNVLIYDWLYPFIYKDLINHFSLKSRVLAKYAVFLVSGLFHEFILGFSFRFCLPILFLQFFGLGLTFTFFESKYKSFSNIVLWYFNSIGMSLNVCSFAMEYYSRVNNPIENVTLSSYFTPQLFYCNKA